jgi:ABC-type transport system involved in multi-copper enzyme maturation permease subunit
MRVVGMLYPLVAADFRERTRRYSFLITLLGTVFFGFLVITGKWTLRLGEYRGEYNSAWVGSLMASASTCMLAFFGFYLVKNALSRDRQSRVGEILATTPLSNFLYIFSKFVSNLAVLALMAATLAAAAVS